jgi:hypothetical protein
MAEIVRSTIPAAALASPDALAAWVLTLLDEIYSGQSLVREAPGIDNPVAAVGEFKDLDRIYRLTARVNIRLAPGYQASPAPIWENVVPIALFATPTAWLDSTIA